MKWTLQSQKCEHDLGGLLVRVIRNTECTNYSSSPIFQSSNMYFQIIVVPKLFSFNPPISAVMQQCDTEVIEEKLHSLVLGMIKSL